MTTGRINQITAPRPGRPARDRLLFGIPLLSSLARFRSRGKGREGRGEGERERESRLRGGGETRADDSDRFSNSRSLWGDRGVKTGRGGRVKRRDVSASPSSSSQHSPTVLGCWARVTNLPCGGPPLRVQVEARAYETPNASNRCVSATTGSHSSRCRTEGGGRLQPVGEGRGPASSEELPPLLRPLPHPCASSLAACLPLTCQNKLDEARPARRAAGAATVPAESPPSPRGHLPVGGPLYIYSKTNM